MTAAALGTATALWLARGMFMLLLPTALSCEGVSFVQAHELRFRQNVSAASRPATLLEHSMPPCMSSWLPKTAVAGEVRAEGRMPCADTCCQLGVGLLRGVPNLKEGVLLDVRLLMSRQQTCMQLRTGSIDSTARNQFVVQSHAPLAVSAWRLLLC